MMQNMEILFTYYYHVTHVKRKTKYAFGLNISFNSPIAMFSYIFFCGQKSMEILVSNIGLLYQLHSLKRNGKVFTI